MENETRYFCDVRDVGHCFESIRIFICVLHYSTCNIISHVDYYKRVDIYPVDNNHTLVDSSIRVPQVRNSHLNTQMLPFFKKHIIENKL